MRTTLDIDDDVLFAAKEIAKREKKTIGQVVSEQARRAFPWLTILHFEQDLLMTCDALKEI